MDLILASSSPRRRELLAKITPHFTVCDAGFDERAVTESVPATLAGALAAGKCRAVAALHPDALVIGCDTVVDVDGAVFGKPRNRDDAHRMLRALAGRAHFVHTGVCLEGGARTVRFCETTRVTFLPLSAAEIEAYIDTGDPFDKAGAYGVQNGACKFVSRIEGCFFNVMGLPVARLYQALQTWPELHL